MKKPKPKRENPEIQYRCRWCDRTHDTKEEFEEKCGQPKLTKDHFKPGDIVEWNRRAYEIKYIDDTGFVGLYKPTNYIAAFGLDSRYYGGPWAAPAGKFCKNSLRKLSLVKVKEQLKLRQKQLKAAERLLLQVEVTHGPGGNATPTPRRARRK